MKNIDNLTIEQVVVPAGRSLSAAELDQAERALFHLVYNYKEQRLKIDLRQLLHTQSEKHTHVVDGEADVGFIILNDELMQPAELFRMIDAAETLTRYLERRISRRLERGGSDAL